MRMWYPILIRMKPGPSRQDWPIINTMCVCVVLADVSLSEWGAEIESFPSATCRNRLGMSRGGLRRGGIGSVTSVLDRPLRNPAACRSPTLFSTARPPTTRCLYMVLL